MNDKVKKYVLPNLPYLFIFWLADKLGQAFRLSAGENMGKRFMDTVNGLALLGSDPLPSLHPRDLLAGIAGAAVIWIVVYFKKKNAKKWRKNIEYGSARWGGPDDIKPFVDPKPENNVILTQTEFLTMNSRPKNPATARNKNCLIVGGSGSGKTRFWLKPNLLQLHSSYVVVDPKGGVLSECGNALKRAKYRIRVFNTINFKKSFHYNPFAYIHSEKDILKLVNCLIANTKGDQKGGDAFWEKAETLLYCALIGYIHYEAPEDEQNMNTLVELINAMDVREDDEDYKNPVDLMFDALEAVEPQHFAVRQYKKYKLAAGKTAKSILISCGARLAPFDIAEVREIMAYDELGLDTLGDRKSALFFIISDTDSTFNFLIAMAFMGMGEPLANPNVFEALSILTNPDLFGLSQRRITLSTIGMIPGIRRMTKDYPQVNLAYSLHSPFEDQRNELMPINKKYPLHDVIKVLDSHIQHTGRKVFIAYILLNQINDSMKHAEALANLLQGRDTCSHLYHVDLIPYNYTDKTEQHFTPSSYHQVQRFQKKLRDNGIEVTVRAQFGSRVNAACGQLYVDTEKPH